MILDETTISEALQAATDELSLDSDLATRVRRGGELRLRRHRVMAAAGVTAVVAAIVPAAIALAPSPSHRGQASIVLGASPSAGLSLYATPPPAGAQCNSGHAEPASDASYPQLLMLPAGQGVSYAFTNSQTSTCQPAHVALTLLRTSGAAVTQGVEIDGPNAPSAAQAGYAGHGVSFSGRIVTNQVNGQPASVFYIPQARSANVFWTGADGAQWQARVRGFSVAGLLTLLNRVQLDPTDGTAMLPDAAADGWTAAPPATDETAAATGIFYAQWNVDGEVDLTVTQAPDRTDELAVALNDSSLIEVHGHPAVLTVSPQFVIVDWQVSPDVNAQLMMAHGTSTEAEQIAASVTPISTTDPRLHRP